MRAILIRIKERDMIEVNHDGSMESIASFLKTSSMYATQYMQRKAVMICPQDAVVDTEYAVIDGHSIAANILIIGVDAKGEDSALEIPERDIESNLTFVRRGV